MQEIGRSNNKRVQLTVGVLSIGFPNFKFKIAEEYLKKTLEHLVQDGVELICNGRTLVTEEEINAEADRLASEGVDLLVVQNGTYSHGTCMMHIITTFRDTPILLWGFTEPIVEGFIGLPLNSLCGLNMFGSFLHKVGKTYSYVYGDVEDVKVYEKVQLTIVALKVKKQLKQSRFCVIGGRAPGFYLSSVDEIRLRHEVGPEIVHYSLASLLRDMEKLPEEEVIKERRNMDGEVFLVTSTGMMMERTARIYLALNEFRKKYNIDGFAIKCWPEFQELANCSVCGVVSRLNNEGIMTSCEGDVTGLLSMYIQYLITNKNCFFADLVNINPNGTVKAWHCGSAPLSLARNFNSTKYTEHPTIRQGMGIAVDFKMMLGPVLMLKVKEETKGYKIFMAKGEAVEEDRVVDANQTDIRFEVGSEAFLDEVMKHGIEHHYAVVYSDIREELKELSRWMDFKVVQI